MSQDRLKVLLIDGDRQRCDQIQTYLSLSELTCCVTAVESDTNVIELIAAEQFDCILTSYHLLEFSLNSVALIYQIRERDLQTPVIVLADEGDEKVAVQVMKAGAADYLAYEQLSAVVLARSIRNAMKVYWAEQQIRAAQAQLRQTNVLLKQQNQELADQRCQIERQNFQLIEANRLKSEFLATMSHELRTPLNAIMGFSQILQSQSRGELGACQMDMVGRILNSGRHLLNLVNDILDMSTIEANRLELVPRHFDVERLVMDTFADLQVMAMRKQLSVKVNIDLDDTIIYNDEKRLKQILVNLLSNAIKFTDAGTIKVQVQVVAPNAIAILVEDTGIGIPASQLDSIFQPFQQADQTTQRRHPGTGLGLAIVHSLVSMMEGLVTVDSEVGKGTCFRVQIPRRIYTPVPQSAPRELNGKNGLVRGRTAALYRHKTRFR